MPEHSGLPLLKFLITQKKNLILTYPLASDSLDRLPFAQALPGIISARPLLARRRFPKLIPNDPRFAWSNSNPNYQWHLNNTGQNTSIAGLDVNVIEVWNKFLGTDVTVSVIDDGVQVAHEDLAPNINPDINHDWNDNTPNDPTPPLSLQGDGTYFSHGTSVAGVIAAGGNNGIGVTGAAPEASIVGLKILADEISGELADPDLDGRNNLLEYAFGGNPKSPEATLPGEPQIIESDGQSKIRFTRNLAKTDIQYTLTRSNNLIGEWLTMPTTATSTNGDLEVRNLIIDSSQKQFFRIKISR